jgi:hypothetical protein
LFISKAMAGKSLRYTTEDAFDRLGRKLIEHCGEDFP